MMKLFLTSSFADVSKHFPDFVDEDFRGKSVTFILFLIILTFHLRKLLRKSWQNMKGN